MTGCGIMFICGMVLRCAVNLKPGLTSYSRSDKHYRTYSKLLINDVKPDHSLTHSLSN